MFPILRFCIRRNVKVDSMRNFSIIKSINFYPVIYICKKEFLFILCTYLALTFIFTVYINVFLIYIYTIYSFFNIIFLILEIFSETFQIIKLNSSHKNIKK